MSYSIVVDANKSVDKRDIYQIFWRSAFNPSAVVCIKQKGGDEPQVINVTGDNALKLWKRLHSPDPYTVKLCFLGYDLAY